MPTPFFLFLAVGIGAALILKAVIKKLGLPVGSVVSLPQGSQTLHVSRPPSGLLYLDLPSRDASAHVAALFQSILVDGVAVDLSQATLAVPDEAELHLTRPSGTIVATFSLASRSELAAELAKHGLYAGSPNPIVQQAYAMLGRTVVVTLLYS